MKKTIIALLVSLTGMIHAHGATDYSPWLGSEAKDWPKAFVQFDFQCNKRFLANIEKEKSPKEVAKVWTESTCKCLHRFLEDKKDLTYLQTVNATISDRLIGKPELHSDLKLYVSGFLDAFDVCYADPTWRFGDNPQKPQMKSEKPAPKGIPVRPQKNSSRKFEPADEGVE